jgi:ribonuclease R
MSEFYTYGQKKFRDRTPVEGITIDGPKTKDMDDAVFIEQRGNETIVSVSIADVSAVVPRGSGIDLVACSHGFTRYFGWGNEPMFPATLSENQLSLVPDHERPTITVTMTLDENLDLKKMEIAQTVLKSSAKWDYETFTSAINDKNEPYASWFRVAERLLEKRRRSGALFVYDLSNNVSPQASPHILE